MNIWRQLLILACLGTAAAAAPEQDACAVLQATPPGGPDTGRIQAALNGCKPRQAVVLSGGAFSAAPLILPREVTLWIAGGAVLHASRNPRDYDLAPGSCAPPYQPSAEGAPARCKPFLYAYQAAFSGVGGQGTIDGQGVAPELVSSYESQGFHVDGVSLRNAAQLELAIYKTIGLRLANVNVESAANTTGILLSNAVDAQIAETRVRVPGDALALRASILGGTSAVSVNGLVIVGGRGMAIGDDVYGSVRNVNFDRVTVDGATSGVRFNRKGTQGGQAQQIHLRNGCLRDVAEPAPDLPKDRDIVLDWNGPGACAASGTASPALPPGPVSVGPRARSRGSVSVGPGHSIQAAIDALPDTGGEVIVQPGTYREVVTIRKPHVHLHGEGDPAQTTIVFNHGPSYGGTFASATVFVEADDVAIDHLTIANDLGAGNGQGVALAVTADRAIFRRLRLLGAQDTLFAASRYCYGDYGPCAAARQYFEDCYIEGNTDFIFGDSLAVFERCELHAIATGSVMYTAQSRHTAQQEASAYVFDHCRLTGAPRNAAISLGRPWRPYATVVFLDAQIDAPVIAGGWTEWSRFGKPSLPTAFYGEFHSTGPGADPQAREPHSHQLTDSQAAEWRPARIFAGGDGWDPAGVH